MKTKFRQLITTTVVLILLVSLFTGMASAAASTKKITKPSDFIDVNGTEWFADNLQYSITHNVISGYDDGSFWPHDKMTRAQFATVIARAFNAQALYRDIFTDVAQNAWYSNYVQWCYNHNIISGVGNSKFDPDANITREQMAVILANAVKNLDLDIDRTREAVPFADDADISSWAKEQVYSCYAYNLLSGNGHGFRPKDSVTRAEGMTAVVNLLRALDTDESEITPEPSEPAQPEKLYRWYMASVVSYTPATESEFGSLAYVCSICGQQHTELIVVQDTPAEDHTHVWSVIQGSEPKQTDRGKFSGVYSGVCIYCGENNFSLSAAPVSGVPDGCVGSRHEHELVLLRRICPSETKAGANDYICKYNCGAFTGGFIDPITDDKYASYNSAINYTEASREVDQYIFEKYNVVVDETMEADIFYVDYRTIGTSAQYGSKDELVTSAKKAVDSVIDNIVAGWAKDGGRSKQAQYWFSSFSVILRDDSKNPGQTEIVLACTRIY